MSEVMILRCDKCKKEIENKTSLVKADILTRINGMTKTRAQICKGDYHYNCFFEILEENFKFKAIQGGNNDK